MRLHHGQSQERDDLHWCNVRLVGRVYQHRQGVVSGFTKQYGCKLLVWFEAHENLDDAGRRELQMKEWKRSWKIRLIEEVNLDWHDLYPTLL